MNFKHLRLDAKKEVQSKRFHYLKTKKLIITTQLAKFAKLETEW